MVIGKKDININIFNINNINSNNNNININIIMNNININNINININIERFSAQAPSTEKALLLPTEVLGSCPVRQWPKEPPRQQRTRENHNWPSL